MVNPGNLGFSSSINNGAEKATSQYLILLNNDIVVTAGWLSAMIAVLEREPTVGIVGSKLLYPDGTVQHAGVSFTDESLPLHAFQYAQRDHPSVSAEREFQAVTGACLAIRRELFTRVGGLSLRYRNSYEDIDLCLAVRQLGHKVIYTPHSVAYHFESKTAKRFLREDTSRILFLERWRDAVVPGTPEEQAIGVNSGAASLSAIETANYHLLLTELEAENRLLRQQLSSSTPLKAGRLGRETRLARLSRDLTYQPGPISDHAVGEFFTVPVMVSRPPASSWPLQEMKLSYRWLATDGSVVDNNGYRSEIGALALKPVCMVEAVVQAPPQQGVYLLEWDAVEEGVAWASSFGVPTYVQLVHIIGSCLRATAQDFPSEAPVATDLSARLSLSGLAEAKLDERDTLTYRWRSSSTGATTAERSLNVIWSEVTASGELVLSVDTPDVAGLYSLELGLRDWDGGRAPVPTLGTSVYVTGHISAATMIDAKGGGVADSGVKPADSARAVGQQGLSEYVYHRHRDGLHALMQQRTYVGLARGLLAELLGRLPGRREV